MTAHKERRSAEPSLEAPPCPRSPRARRLTADELELLADRDTLSAVVTDTKRDLENLQRKRDDWRRGLDALEDEIAGANDKLIQGTRTIAIMDMHLTARDPVAFEAVLRSRISAWVAGRRATMERDLGDVAVADALGAWESELLTLAPKIAEVARRYPPIARDLEELLALLHACRVAEGLADVTFEAHSEAEVRRACATVGEFVARHPMLGVLVQERLVSAYRRAGSVPAGWRAEPTRHAPLTDAEDRLVTWFLQNAGRAGLDLRDLADPAKFGSLLQVEQILRDLDHLALGCHVLCDLVRVAGVSGDDRFRIRGKAAVEITDFIARRARKPLYNFAFELLRVALPAVTANCTAKESVRKWVREEKRRLAGRE